MGQSQRRGKRMAMGSVKKSKARPDGEELRVPTNSVKLRTMRSVVPSVLRIPTARQLERKIATKN